MGIEIKLDKPSLQYLIDTDPNFRLELQSCIVKFISTREFLKVDKSLEEEVRKYITSEFYNSTDFTPINPNWSSQKRLKIKDEVLKELIDQVDFKTDDIGTLIRNRVNSLLDSHIEYEVNRLIKIKVDKYISEQIKIHYDKMLEKLKVLDK